MSDLDRIVIRARRVGEGWGSYALSDLLASANGGEIARWFYERIGARVGLLEGAVVTADVAGAMVDLLERLGDRLVRLEDGASAPPEGTP